MLACPPLQSVEGRRVGRLTVLPQLLAGVLGSAGEGELARVLRLLTSEGDSGEAWGIQYPQVQLQPYTNNLTQVQMGSDRWVTPV